MFNIEGKNKVFRTVIGGVGTMVIYLLSLAYFCYVIYQWQTDQFLPKASDKLVPIKEETEVVFDYAPIEIELFYFQPVPEVFDGTNIFDGPKQLFVPMISTVTSRNIEGAEEMGQNLESDCESTFGYTKPYCFATSPSSIPYKLFFLSKKIIKF